MLFAIENTREYITRNGFKNKKYLPVKQCGIKDLNPLLSNFICGVINGFN